MQRIDKGPMARTKRWTIYGGFSGGRITGLLGPNSSGKNDADEAGGGLLVPTGGSLRVCGQAPGPQTKARGVSAGTHVSARRFARARALELFCDFTLISAGKRRSMLADLKIQPGTRSAP